MIDYPYHRPSYSYDVLDDSNHEIQVEFEHSNNYPKEEINVNEEFHFQIDPDQNSNQQDEILDIQGSEHKMGYGIVIPPRYGMNLNDDEVHINTGAQMHEKYSSVNLETYDEARQKN